MLGSFGPPKGEDIFQIQLPEIIREIPLFDLQTAAFWVLEKCNKDSALP
jgi:hypothetical protein